MMCLKMHMNNVRINEAYILRLEKVIHVHTGPSRRLQCDDNGMLRVKTIANKWVEGSNSDFTGNMPSDTSVRTPSQIHEDGNMDKPENLSLEKDQQKVKELHSMLVRNADVIVLWPKYQYSEMGVMRHGRIMFS